jgi:predicted lipoprotein with Yx(FWY)xxD motif
VTRSNTTPRRKGSRAIRQYAVLALSVVASAVIASGVAMAAGGTRVVGAANNSTLGEMVVVDTHGRTLYALHPETTHHLLCRSHACLETWPALMVHSANVKLVAGHGVEGHLGLLRRGDGKWQVTLRGMPVYRFAGDSAKGQANGEGIKSFGGTWHAVKAQAKSTAQPGTQAPTTSTPSMTPTPAPAPGY